MNIEVEGFTREQIEAALLSSARKVRYEAKQLGLDVSKIETVYSSETPTKNGKDLASLIPVTSTCGLIMSKYIILYFIN